MFSKLTAYWKAFWKVPETAILSPYQRAILLLQGAPTANATVYRDLLPLSVISSNIVDYTEMMLRAIQALEENELFRKAEDPVIMLIPISRAGFYTRQGQFINVEESHQTFITVAVALLTLYERSFAIPNPSGLLRTNLTRIQPVISNLLSLAEQLNEVQ